MIFPESPPSAVLAAYPLEGIVWEPLGSAGGFSGSRIWRGTAPDARLFALKAYPAGRVDRTILETTVHRWMKEAGLPFVPRIEAARDGRTTVAVGGRMWDLSEWMPGRADFHASPSNARLANAVTALAELHRCWARLGVIYQSCPGVGRRMAALRDWSKLIETGWRPTFSASDGPLGEPAVTAWRILPGLVRQAIRDLEPWLSIVVPTHPCLCDVWHDHILFERDSVRGLIDFAAAKIDHPAVDLARLLGSLIGDDREQMVHALDVYRASAPLAEPELVPILDRTGIVVAAIHWLRRLFLDRQTLPDRTAVADRLHGIVTRLM